MLATRLPGPLVFQAWGQKLSVPLAHKISSKSESLVGSQGPWS